MEYAGFVGPAYQVQSISADAQRCVNLYVQQDESGGGKSKSILLSTPGLAIFSGLNDTGPGAVRGEYVTSKGRLFAVVGNITGSYLVELGSNGAVIGTYVLTGETGTGQVSFTDNGLSMMILTGPNGYWFNFSALGNINSLVIDVPGTGWAVGDTFTIAGGLGGIGTVIAQTGGIPSAIAISSIGSGYSNAAGLVATAIYPSVGVGLTVSVTVLAADTLMPITDEVFEGGTQCGFMDGYVIFNQPGTQKFWITNLYSTVINPIGFASAEGQPDTLLGLLVDHRELWLFSTTHTEVWYDSGNANFPFAYIQGAYISHGISSVWASNRLDNTVFWIGQDEFGTAIAWRANGYAPLRVSTYAMEQAWQRYPLGASDATSWTYQQDGHSFWVVNFPSGNATFVYDAATGQWHQRAYLGTYAVNDGQLYRGRPNSHVFAFGKHIVGDWENGNLYVMSPAYADDVDREVARIRAAPYINNENKRITFSQFELAMEVGMGNPGDPALPPPVDPQISLRWSNDGGYTWSAYLNISMGESGQYLKRVLWRRLGQSRTRIFEVSTGQRGINLAMYAAYLELEGQTS